MKKILKILFGLSLICCLSSCSMLIDIILGALEPGVGFGEETVSKEITLDNNGKDAYLVKLNKNKNRSYAPTDLGTITGIRSIIDAEAKNNSYPVPNTAFNNEEINKLNQNVIEMMSKSDAARGIFDNTTNETDWISCETVSFDYRIGDKRNFWVINNKNESVQAVGKYVYSGKYCDIWFIDDNPLHPQFTYSDYKALADTFDMIYPLEIKVMGDNKYNRKPNDAFRDPGEKVFIILCDCMMDATADQTGGVFGYNFSGDLYKDDILNDESNGKTRSNEVDCLYIDSQFYSYRGQEITYTYKDENGKTQTATVPIDCYKQILSTIPHEYNHLINFIQKLIVRGLDSGMETWNTEMLSMVMEDLLMEKMGLTGEESSRGRMPYFDYFHNMGFKIWQEGDGVYASYANAFAYGAFLCRNYGGEKLIHEIATNEYVNEKSVTEALKKVGYNKTFEDTLKEFPKVLVNWENTSGTTLNKTGTVSTYGLSLTPISLKCSAGKNEKGEEEYFYPKINKSNEAGPGVYPYGFQIHSIGNTSKVKQFTLNYYESIEDVLEQYVVYEGK